MTARSPRYAYPEPPEEEIQDDIRSGTQQAEAGAGKSARDLQFELEMISITCQLAVLQLFSSTDLIAAMAKHYKVNRVQMVGEIVDDELPPGRPIVFVYDPAECHTLSDYIDLSRALQGVLSYPVCLLNRKPFLAHP